MNLSNAHEGYDYQDLITSYFILKEILEGNLESVFSIDKKNTSGDIPDRFDDLVIINGAYIQRKQIKYSNESVAKVLIKDYLSSDSTYSIALHKLFETWKSLKTSNTEFRLCLAWDEPNNDDIKRVLKLQTGKSSFSDFPTKTYKVELQRLWEETPENFNNWRSLSHYVKENSVDRKDFNEFCNDLLIEVNLPKASLKFNSPHQLEEILIEQAKKLGIEQYPNDDVYISDFLERLAKLVGAYRTRSAQVSARDILCELRVRTDFGRLEQKFEIDQNKNIISDEKNNLFVENLILNKKTILLGEPGAGKSWFLTNLINYLKINNHNVIHHYCFTGVEDPFFEKRVSSDVFFGNLISDIEQIFPEIRKTKNKLFAANLEELNILLSVVDEPLIIIVDGLDHIDRTLRTSVTLSKEKTRIIDCISKIVLPPNVTILLGSQPTGEVETLAENNDFSTLNLPKWDVENTKELMGRFNCEDILINDKNLSNLLHEKSEGSPLYLTYILKTLDNYQTITEEIIEILPKYDFNLRNYYEYLTSQIGNNTTSEILSCLEFAVSRKELKEIIPMKRHFDSDMKVLSPVISENTSRGGVKLYHDSFRRFNIEKLSSTEDVKEIYEYIANWLSIHGFYENDKSYRYLLKYLTLSERYEDVRRYAEKNFLSRSLYYGHSESLIKNNYKMFLQVAEISQDWPLFIYAGELYRAIYTTNSEENHSQFLDNFELYFEAICAIYGTEKANALLFFNGEKNHSSKIVAKAFKILQEYGYSPYWEEIGELFKGRISLEDFRYFICYQLQNNADLDEVFNSVLPDKYSDFFRIFIEEVFSVEGFDAISNLYGNIDSDRSNSVALKINAALEGINCEQRISIVDDKEISKLEPLDLSFIENYDNGDDINIFYRNVEKYALYDISALIDFEKEIPQDNFVWIWIKYFIRLFIIEKKCADANKENEVIENFRFLSSDVAPYKGNPKPAVFSHHNSNLIDRTIARALRYINSKTAWEDAISNLKKIPHPTLPMIEKNFLNNKNIHFIIDAYNQLDSADNDEYHEHAEYSFRKAIYYGRAGMINEAKAELEKALLLITSYTSRKDTTLTELIEPLPAINNINPDLAKQYTRNLKYLTDAVMKHTEDGKGIRWLTIDWFEQLLNVDYELATMYLVKQFLTDEYFWKLDYMFVIYLQKSNAVDPVVLNFLYKLSPTNNRINYLSGFLDVITELEKIDRRLAEISLIGLSNRNWDYSNAESSNKVKMQFFQMKDKFGIISSDNDSIRNNERVVSSFGKNELSDNLTKWLCKKVSLSGGSEVDLIDYYKKLDKLSDEDLNFVYFFLEANKSEELSTAIILSLIEKRFPRDIEEHFNNIRTLIDRLLLTDAAKVHLFISNFVYSKDGSFYCFVDKESLKRAIEIDRVESLNILAQLLRRVFSNSDFMYKYAANLIIAFEYAGLDGDTILSMYEVGFNFIESRLPDRNDFKWESVECAELLGMNHNELAIVMMLSKIKNLDTFVQRDIIVAISYIVKYDESMLIKPLKWFFNNTNFFPQLSVAGILELLLIDRSNHSLLINSIREELHALSVENLYIKKSIQDILIG